MLAWLIFWNLYKSLANDDGSMRVAAIILMQATLNIQNVCFSLGHNNSVYKNVENSLRFNSFHVIP